MLGSEPRALCIMYKPAISVSNEAMRCTQVLTDESSKTLLRNLLFCYRGRSDSFLIMKIGPKSLSRFSHLHNTEETWLGLTPAVYSSPCFGIWWSNCTLIWEFAFKLRIELYLHIEEGIIFWFIKCFLGSYKALRDISLLLKYSTWGFKI